MLDEIIATLTRMQDEALTVMADATEDDNDELFTIYQARKIALADAIGVVRMAQPPVVPDIPQTDIHEEAHDDWSGRHGRIASCP